MAPPSDLRRYSVVAASLVLCIIFLMSAEHVLGRTPVSLVVNGRRIVSSLQSSSSTSLTRAQAMRLKRMKRRVRAPTGQVVSVPSRRTTSSSANSTAPAITATLEKARCGDGFIIGNETCDDGNVVGNDGCSTSCTIETGFNCNGAQPTRCLSECGDGVVATNEGCDDNNVSYGDGCSGKCKVEVGFKCTGSLSVCTGICGNSQLQTGEQCDDGNTKDSDGCSASCTIEASSSSS